MDIDKIIVRTNQLIDCLGLTDLLTHMYFVGRYQYMQPSYNDQYLEIKRPHELGH